MNPAAISWRIEEFPTLASTSDLCRTRAAEGAAEGLAIRADTQTSGRGTNGRTWVSPPGNLYFSLLLRPAIPAAESGQYALLAGLAVAEALQPHAHRPLTLKWPNDILLDGAKLAGILVESATTGPTLDWLVIGIGANLASAPILPDRPTAHLNAPPVRAATQAILARLEAWEHTRRRAGFAPIRAAWSARAGLPLSDAGHPLPTNHDKPQETVPTRRQPTCSSS